MNRDQAKREFLRTKQEWCIEFRSKDTTLLRRRLRIVKGATFADACRQFVSEGVEVEGHYYHLGHKLTPEQWVRRYARGAVKVAARIPHSATLSLVNAESDFSFSTGDSIKGRWPT